MRILLVEDNEMNRDMLSRRLARRGYEVLIAVDGEQGSDIAQAEMPDVILMDLNLPKMSGWELTRQLKGDLRTAHIPFIALTAHALNSDRELARSVGCDDFETKPIDFARLLFKIDAAARVNREQTTE
ncbi:MAG TPA: response regulator [Bryobacteraceae bacterium]